MKRKKAPRPPHKKVASRRLLAAAERELGGAMEHFARASALARKGLAPSLRKQGRGVIAQKTTTWVMGACQKIMAERQR